MEPRFNEPLYNEVLHIMNGILQPGRNYSKMYGTEPRYNEPRYTQRNPRYNEPNPEAQTQNVPRYNELMPKRKER